MDLPLVLLLIGFLYTFVFGGLSLLRREGLSGWFAVQAIFLTVAASGLAAFTPLKLDPILFLILLYLVTMRVRLLVDLGNLFARRGSYARAQSLYNLAESLFPSHIERIIVAVNRGAALLQQGMHAQAIETFQSVLANSENKPLGVKHEAAARYNLGVAYRRSGSEALAVVELNKVLEVWPTSLYAHKAALALGRGKSRSV